MGQCNKSTNAGRSSPCIFFRYDSLDPSNLFHLDDPCLASTNVQTTLHPTTTARPLPCGPLCWPHSSLCCHGTARKGHLEVLTYAHEEGCPGDEITCANASQQGKLETLMDAHDHGCPWDKNTCSNAAESRHWNILKCMLYHGCHGYSGRLDIGRTSKASITLLHYSLLAWLASGTQNASKRWMPVEYPCPPDNRCSWYNAYNRNTPCCHHNLRRRGPSLRCGMPAAHQ